MQPNAALIEMSSAAKALHDTLRTFGVISAVVSRWNLYHIYLQLSSVIVNLIAISNYESSWWQNCCDLDGLCFYRTKLEPKLYSIASLFFFVSLFSLLSLFFGLP
jgi:hypothetical protein